MCSSVGDRTCLLPGFPIRKSSDQRSVDSSPRLIAASYVLHRLLVPRHPPCALNNLTTHTPTPTHPPPPAHTPKGTNHGAMDRRGYPDTARQKIILLDARVHCAVLNVRKMTAHPAPPAPNTRAVRHQNDLSHKETVTRSLRTQQRAYDRLPRPTTFPTPPKGGGTSGNQRHRP